MPKASLTCTEYLSPYSGLMFTVSGIQIQKFILFQIQLQCQANNMFLYNYCQGGKHILSQATEEFIALVLWPLYIVLVIPF